jgi:hypothetical protein
MIARKYEELFNTDKNNFIKLFENNIIDELSKGLTVTVVLYSQNHKICELEQSIIDKIVKAFPNAINYINIISY